MPPPPPPPEDPTLSFKRSAVEYLSWGLRMCVLAGGCTGLFVDFVPADGVLRQLSPAEEALLGQALERATRERLKPSCHVTRLQCSAQTTEEVFYAHVVHAVRVAALARSAAAQAQANASNGGGAPGSLPTTLSTPSVFILQDIDRAPPRTLAFLDEIINTQVITTPAANAMGFAGAMEGLRLPVPFVVVATSSNLPRPSATTTLYAPPPDLAAANAGTGTADCTLSDRVMNAFLLRIPILLPREPPVQMQAPSPQPPPPPPGTVAPLSPAALRRAATAQGAAAASFSPAASEASSSATATPPGAAPAAAATPHISAAAASLPTPSIFLPPTATPLPPSSVHVSPDIARVIRDLASSLRSDPLVETGPSPFVPDVLTLAVRNCAALRGSRFVTPLDLNMCVVEVLAHRIVVAHRPEVNDEDAGALHPVLLSRAVVAAAYAHLAPLR